MISSPIYDIIRCITVFNMRILTFFFFQSNEKDANGVAKEFIQACKEGFKGSLRA